MLQPLAARQRLQMPVGKVQVHDRAGRAGIEQQVQYFLVPRDFQHQRVIRRRADADHGDRFVRGIARGQGGADHGEAARQSDFSQAGTAHSQVLRDGSFAPGGPDHRRRQATGRLSAGANPATGNGRCCCVLHTDAAAGRRGRVQPAHDVPGYWIGGWRQPAALSCDTVGCLSLRRNRPCPVPNACWI